jgi:phosphoribosylanthranilate isomerase
MFVKICGITNEDDALLAVALGADALGFVFAPSTRQVVASKVYDITRRLPPEIMTVGVFKDEHPSRVIELVHTSGVRAAQLHGRETPEVAHHVHSQVGYLIKAFAAGSEALNDASRYGADFILLDAPTPGSGQMFDWSLAENYPEDAPPMLLAGGLTPENVATAVRRVKPFGVDVSSGVEASPGRKDARKMREFIKAARSVSGNREPSRDPFREHGTVGADRDSPFYDWMDE